MTMMLKPQRPIWALRPVPPRPPTHRPVRTPLPPAYPTPRRVRAFLLGLRRPRTVRDVFRLPSTRVANRLREMGVTGRRYDKRDCPIAGALRREFGDHGWQVHALRVEAKADGMAEVRMPWALRSFIMRFDRRKFPDLAGGPASCPIPLCTCQYGDDGSI